MMAPRHHRRPAAAPATASPATSTAQATGSRIAAGGGGTGTGAGTSRRRNEGEGGGGRGRGGEEDAAKRLIDAMFERAVDIIQTLPKSGHIQTSYDDKLLLYSLFKQATEGSVKTSRPGMLDMIGRAKWDAWNKRKDLSEEDAKRLYVDSLVKILRGFGDDAQAVALARELENFTADPRDLVRSGHSMSEARATAGGRPRSSSSRGSSEDEESDDSVPPASLGPYVTRAQLPAPVEVQNPPSDRRSLPDSVARAERQARRRARHAPREETTEEETDDSTESQPAAPPSRSLASRPYSTQGPMPLPPPPPHHPLYHQSLQRGGSLYGPPPPRFIATPAGAYSGVSTPAGAGTPLPPGGRFAVPPPVIPSAPATGPPSVAGAAWPSSHARPPPPSLPGAPPLSPIPAGGYPPAHPLAGYGSPSGLPGSRDPRVLETALDLMQTRLAAMQERLAMMEQSRRTGRQDHHHHHRPVSATLALFHNLLRLLGLRQAGARETGEEPLTMTRLAVAVFAGFLGAARRLAVDAVVVGLLVGMFLRWRRGEAVIGWREILRWMFGDARVSLPSTRRAVGDRT